ncbi:MAG: glutamate racemase [Planctomycetota bacterium]
MNNNPIAVFDSGLGGLSVVRHLRQLLPAEDIVYFGDTARVPYGTKSRRTVATFAKEDARFLLQFEPKLIVVACNTVSAIAMDELEAEIPVPIVGVLKPGAEAAVCLAQGAPIGVIGTEATVSSNAYCRAIEAISPGALVIQQACPLFVPIVEEGRACTDAVVRHAARGYLASLRDQGVRVVVLGCTHYPLLRDAIAAVLGPKVAIVDSGEATSHAVEALLTASGALSSPDRTGTMRAFVSDHPARFRMVGSRFLNHDIEDVQLVEPERYIHS